MSKAKTNPRRKPATQADVQRARDDGRHQGDRGMLCLILWTLIGEMGMTDEDVNLMGDRLKVVVDGIRRGNLTYKEIEDTLKDEFDWIVDLV